MRILKRCCAGGADYRKAGNTISRSACKEIICSRNALIEGAHAESAGHTATLLAAVEMRDSLGADEEIELVTLFTERAEVERKFANRMQALARRVWEPLLQ
jgi:hypothetical protein